MDSFAHDLLQDDMEWNNKSSLLVVTSILLDYTTLSEESGPHDESTIIDSNSYDEYVAYSERLETYLVPVVLGIIFLVGLIGNGCLICIFCREPSVRSSVPNTFILNLALGDLLVLFWSIPFTSTIYTLESWPYGELVCKTSEFAKVNHHVLRDQIKRVGLVIINRFLD